MNSAAALLDELGRSGARVRRSGGQLVVDGPETVVSDTLVERIRSLKKELLATFDEWTARDWRSYFERARVAARTVGRSSRREAEAQAYGACIVEWISQNHRASSPERCVQCHAAEREGATLVPFGTDRSGHTWLHLSCWPTWVASRRSEAVAALSVAGVDDPGPAEVL